MSKNGGRKVPCLHCGSLKLHHCRGLCKCCYNHAVADGYVNAYPTADELAADPGRRIGLGTEERPRSTGRPIPWKQGGMTQ